MPSTKMRCCFTGIPTVFARRAQMKLIALLPPTVVRNILLPSAPMTQTFQTGLRNFLPARRETTTAMAVLRKFGPASFLVSKSWITFIRSYVLRKTKSGTSTFCSCPTAISCRSIFLTWTGRRRQEAKVLVRRDKQRGRRCREKGGHNRDTTKMPHNREQLLASRDSKESESKRVRVRERERVRER